MKTLEKIGIDFWDRPVYRDNTGKLWKDINCGYGVPDLYSVSDNDFDGEPYYPIRHDYVILNSSC